MSCFRKSHNNLKSQELPHHIDALLDRVCSVPWLHLDVSTFRGQMEYVFRPRHATCRVDYSIQCG